MLPVIQLSSGATEADIIAALGSLTGGGTVILPPGETIAIRSGLNIDVARRDITLDLNGGTLQQAANVAVVTGRAVHTPMEQVALSQDTAGHTTVTYANLPASVVPGTWLKVVADDTLPGDRPDGGQPTRMGQALQVAAVNGNTVTLAGTLVDQPNYRTNVRATEYVSGELVVKNGEIIGAPSVANGAFPLVQLRGLIDPKVEDLSLHDGVGKGISVVDSVNASVTDVIIKNLNDGAGSLGIGVHSLSSSGTTVAGLYAENVTHATDANAIGNAANSHAVYYGGDIGLDVQDSVAYATRNFAWTWHSEVVNASYDNVLAMDSYGFLNARGIGNEITNSGGANNERGILLYEWGDGDAREITIDTVTLKETLHYSTAAVNQPRDNRIIDSWFESYNFPTPLDEAYATTTGTTYVRIDPANENDVIVGSSGSNLLLGGKGNDLISGNDGDDYIWGGATTDTLFGGWGRDRFAFHDMSEAGDTIADFQGGLWGDQIDLSVLSARLNWSDGDPVANGYLRWLQVGNDVQVQIDPDGIGGDFTTLATLTGVTVASLSAANVTTSMQSSGVDVITGTSGNDELRGDETANIMDGGGGNDRVFGLGNNDWLFGGEGNDTLYAGDGDDLLDGGAGADTLSGSSGYDTATYANATQGLTADLTNGANNAGAAAGDVFSSIENLTGSAFDDTLRGNQVRNVLEGGGGADQLFGLAGVDTIRGGDGNDVIDGGAGKDMLTGGAGADTFYFVSPAEAGDTITDFSADDMIALSGAGFGVADLEDIQFVAGGAPTGQTPAILYDTTTGRLNWDADGTGSGTPVSLAVLDHAPELTLHDFVIT
jgi:Ca2+-binding RTX toxin-like protein